MIVSTAKGKNAKHTLYRISEVLWKNGLLNSHILIEENGNWLLYTFMPFQKDCVSVDNVKMEIFTPLNYTQNMMMTVENLYPKKLTNFHQCPLFAGVSYLPPFAFIKNDSNGNAVYRGIDIDIVTQISKELNFAIVFNASVGIGRGVFYPNGTTTGNYDLVRI